MIKLLANIATALSLMLSASVAAPAWSADKAGSAKCHHKAKQAKRTTPAAVAPPARSVMVVEKRKMDVQILSFGP